MSVMAQATKAVEQARNAYNAGNYQVGVALLQPFVGPGARKLSSRIELDVVKWLSAGHRGLGDDRAALPHAQRWLELTMQLHPPRSRQHAEALQELCEVQVGLKTLDDARKTITDALAIMDKLGLRKDAVYGGMLLTLGSVESDQGHCKEALVTYIKARLCWSTSRTGPITEWS